MHDEGIERINALGHVNVRAEHKTTLEFTREEYLTPRGDCIVAVCADKGCAQLSEGFKESLRREDTLVEITIECGSEKDTVTARGHPGLELSHLTDIVVRKSGFVCSRTLAVGADKSAAELDRGLVARLRGGGRVVIELKIL